MDVASVTIAARSADCAISCSENSSRAAGVSTSAQLRLSRTSWAPRVWGRRARLQSIANRLALAFDGAVAQRQLPTILDGQLGTQAAVLLRQRRAHHGRKS